MADDARAQLDAAARDNARRLSRCAHASGDSLPYLVLRVTNGNTPSGNTVHAASDDWDELRDAQLTDKDQLHALDARSWHELGYAIDALSQRTLVDPLVHSAKPTPPAEAARLVRDARSCETPGCGCRYRVFARRGGSFAALFGNEMRAVVCGTQGLSTVRPAAQTMTRTPTRPRASADEDSMCAIV